MRREVVSDAHVSFDREDIELRVRLPRWRQRARLRLGRRLVLHRERRDEALRRAGWLYEAVPEQHRAEVSKALQEVRVPGGEQMLKSSQVGAAEGVAYLAILAGIVVFALQVTNFGFVPEAIPVEGGNCYSPP